MMINANHPEMCRAVILEDGRVNDYIVENVSQEKIKGNIYLGVINRIEPAIEAAFCRAFRVTLAGSITPSRTKSR